MIYFDTTEASRWKHSSGLARVSRRLLAELGSYVVPADWDTIVARAGEGDWVFTPELFSERERPGIGAYLDSKRCRVAALYHDAIPLKHPETTWPASVERHAGYMKLLSKCDRVWAVSKASQRELQGFWNWQGVLRTPAVEVLALGADGLGQPRRTVPVAPAVPPRIVCVGILEPRKNQEVLLQAGIELGLEGVAMELHLVGRVNPHFGDPVRKRVRGLRKAWPSLRHHESMGDHELAELISGARATAFPSLAEGCGLPVLESLWLGVPCVTGDIPPVLESVSGGGCQVVRGGRPDGWKSALRALLTDDGLRERLAREACGRTLRTWAGTARELLEGLG